ncbi:putative n-acetyltransferase-like protein [Diaporthe ampelina]|uniref:Putative n-acetyltransferase-like protein n=1 Tax=Diaporthe ampelina TaxID=1214573 RepID=A0A0G2IFZ0_9PEZI|nr:putative n-acetyltransferase-like protein [Diaporthe ampelina]
MIQALPVTALPPSTPSPHPSATIVPVTDAHIPALRRINALLLPVNYTDGFYKAILDPAQSGLFSRAILFRDGPGSAAAVPAPGPKVVGGLVCRLEPSPFDPSTGAYSPDLARRAQARVSPPDSRVLYVQSLGVLAPYRGLGLAAAAVEGIFDAVRAVAADARGNGLNIGWIYAHVWTENHDALEWYARRGFERDGRLDNYYFKLQPGSAWVMKRRVLPLGVGEEAAGGSQRMWAATNGHAAHQPSAVPASVTAAAVNLPGFPPAAGMSTPPPSAANGPRPAARPGPPGSSLSFQNKRPDMEWNDLPEDMVATARTTSRTKDLLSPPTGSGSSSRSSSTAGRKKKDRAYPTAAFGS